uniref:Uncharacterized protein n=1 Tax=Oryza rufipogon TaxID=4529 RepID=A0A0E0N775_ORYRU
MSRRTKRLVAPPPRTIASSSGPPGTPVRVVAAEHYGRLLIGFEQLKSQRVQQEIITVVMHANDPEDADEGGELAYAVAPPAHSPPVQLYTVQIDPGRERRCLDSDTAVRRETAAAVAAYIKHGKPNQKRGFGSQPHRGTKISALVLPWCQRRRRCVRRRRRRPYGLRRALARVAAQSSAAPSCHAVASACGNGGGTGTA